MSSVLVESIDLLAPYLLPELTTFGAVADLNSLADHLPPILQGGFECRLNGNTSQVDLQQCISAEESQPETLKEYISKIVSSSIAENDTWSRLQDFLEEWLQPDSLLQQNIIEIWLEFDNQGGADSLPIPAIFLGFPQKALSKAEIFPVLEKALNLLLGDTPWHQWKNNLERCFIACSDPVFVSHVGIMLSRNSPALRVNIKRLQADSLIPYLQSIGWENETESLAILASQLFSLVERITICLDVGTKIYPRIGLECIFLNQPPDESRWGSLLDYLITQKLCQPAKKEALLNWVGQTTPLNAETSWSSQLIVESLLKPNHNFTSFDRRLSHIKVTWQPNHPLKAKAYLWFQHRWLSGESKT